MFIIIFIIAFVVSIIAVVEICKKEYVNAIIAAIFSFGLFCIAGLFNNDRHIDKSPENNLDSTQKIAQDKIKPKPVRPELMWLINNVNNSLEKGEYNLKEGDYFSDFILMRINFLNEVAQGRYFLGGAINRDSVNHLMRTDNEIKEGIEKSKVLAKKVLANTSQKYRRAYGKALSNELWTEDYKIRVSGKTITFIHYSYAANRNIAADYQKYHADLKSLGFKRANFKWIDANTEYTYYTID